MRKIFLIVPVLAWMLTAKSQSETEYNPLKRHAISNSGCTVNMNCDPAESWANEMLNDSAILYRGECTSGIMKFGVWCLVKLKESTGAERVQFLYLKLQDIKTRLGIAKSESDYYNISITPNGKNHFFKEYLSDKEKINWHIYAITDGKYFGFLYASGKKDIKNDPAVYEFLYSFRFPEN
jgi:hypothetical protein